MKREDQIDQAATDYCRKYKDSELTSEYTALLAFVDGAQWADEHPNENPETNPVKKYRREVAELAKQLLPDCGFQIREAFGMAEELVLSKYSYILKGDINYKSNK